MYGYIRLFNFAKKLSGFEKSAKKKSDSENFGNKFSDSGKNSWPPPQISNGRCLRMTIGDDQLIMFIPFLDTIQYFLIICHSLLGPVTKLSL